jgi:hypothetical protein
MNVTKNVNQLERIIVFGSQKLGNISQDYAHTSCQDGYSVGYDNKLQGTVNEIVQKYRDSTAYQLALGFDAGAIC